jgi:uncharacterized protein
VFRRKIYESLRAWKEESSGRTAILVEGARRVGKSTTVEEFCRNEYADYLLVDFSKEGQDVRANFTENIGHLDTFFRNLFLIKGKSLPVDRRCAIVFDEVQLFPQARQAVKALVADGRYDYIETGSLISIRKNVDGILIPSEERRVQMHPMDFEEFCWACGDGVAVRAAAEAFRARRPLGQIAHRAIMKRFREYMAVGGMPQAVCAFAEGKTFHEVDAVKRAILELYEADLAKYDAGGHGKAAAAYRSIPRQLEGKRFKLSAVDSSWRMGSARDSLDFLEQAMVVNLCRGVDLPDVSLELYANDSFKMYSSDTGLFVTQILKAGSQTEDALYKALVLDKLGVNLGLVMENLVAQMLVAGGHRLYFHEFSHTPKKEAESKGAGAREKRYEIDFLTVRGKRVCPIEVKSSGYKTHKSLDCLSEKYSGLKMDEEVVLHTKDVSREGRVAYLPLYMAMFL